MRILILNLILLISVSSGALESVRMNEGRTISYENGLIDSSKPAFIFLPGINRGLDDRDQFIQLAKKKKLNFISMHFSLHPDSLRLLKENEIPYFKDHRMTHVDLAEEVLFLIKKLNIEKPIVTGLSYSSIVTNELYKNYELSPIIQTAPMIRYNEVSSAGSLFVDYWKSIYKMNPFATQDSIRTFLRKTYFQYWLDSLSKTLPLAEESLEKRTLFAEGYSELSLISDDFDMTTEIVASETQKLYFILAENEISSRRDLQNIAVKAFTQTNTLTPEVITISRSGHIVPTDAPADYLKALNQILKASF